MSKYGRRTKKPPEGFEYIEETLEALESEMNEKIAEPAEGKRKNEVMWPIHQINWQRSRYVYDMYYIHKKISKKVYDYCLECKLVDAGLISKWKKPGYEKLCSTYVINSKNYPYGNVSICRVPRQHLKEGQIVEDAFCGCLGCASGSGGYVNIFGNKYGQRLAKIQIKREEQMKVKALQQQALDEQRLAEEERQAVLEAEAEAQRKREKKERKKKKKEKKEKKKAKKDVWVSKEEEIALDMDEANQASGEAAVPAATGVGEKHALDSPDTDENPSNKKPKIDTE